MSCLTAVLEVIRSWWYVDQIRVPRATGRLLQVAAGERLLIRDEVYVVREKASVFAPKQEKDESAACIGVRYTLDVHQPTQFTTWFVKSHEGHPCAEITYVLEVVLGDETFRPLKIQFIKNGESEQMFEDDVTILKTDG